MTLKDMFNVALSFPMLRKKCLEENREIPRNVKYPGQWLEKHNPEKHARMFKEWRE